MVRSLTKYWCETCGAEHPTHLQASACEAQGWPDASLTVGDWVGAWWNIHGWWRKTHNLAGVLVMERREGELHSPPRERNTWRPPEMMTEAELAPGGGWWFMPLYRVAHVGVRSNGDGLCWRRGGTGLGAHVTEYVLWTPFHVNGSSEKLTQRAADAGLAVLQRPDGVPRLAEAQAARFDTIVDQLARSGRVAVPRRLALVEAGS